MSSDIQPQNLAKTQMSVTVGIQPDNVISIVLASFSDNQSAIHTSSFRIVEQSPLNGDNKPITIIFKRLKLQQQNQSHSILCN